MDTVYLICGVSGSGKSWVCRQLAEKFFYIPHDNYKDTLVTTCRHLKTDLPLITECPFGERLLREDFERHGFKVHPYFVIEAPELCAKRYQEREGKLIQASAYTRASTIIQRAIEWDAPYGTSSEVLIMLKLKKL